VAGKDEQGRRLGKRTSRPTDLEVTEMTLFKSISKVLVIVGLIAVVAAPAAAGASERRVGSERTRCGGEWQASGACNFKYAGGGISIKGNFVASEELGYVNVLLEAVDAESGARYPVLSCGTVSTDFGACGAVSTDSPTVELERGQKLVCTVTGADHGKYSCASFPR
jgi:hypothetical protein